MTYPAEQPGSGTLADLGTAAFWLSVPFPLRSKSNFRRGQARSAGREWGSLRSFESSVALLLTAARPAAWDCGSPDVPVAERPVVVCVIAARSLVDTANFSKSVLDAAQGVLFVSDASVTGVGSLGVRARRDQEALLVFAQLPAGAGLAATAEMLAALTRQAAVLAGDLLPN